MAPALLLDAAREALLLALALSLPVVGISALVGVVVAAFQSASQLQDPTLAHLPRLLAVIVSLIVLGPWIGHQLGAFAEQMLLMAAR